MSERLVLFEIVIAAVSGIPGLLLSGRSTSKKTKLTTLAWTCSQIGSNSVRCSAANWFSIGLLLTLAAPPAESHELTEQDRYDRRDCFRPPLDTGGVKIEPLFRKGVHLAHTIRDRTQELSNDLPVMETRGRTASAAILLGSVALETLVERHCPILVVKQLGTQIGVLRALVLKPSQSEPGELFDDRWSRCRNHVGATHAEARCRLEEMPIIAEDLDESVGCRTREMQSVTCSNEDIVWQATNHRECTPSNGVIEIEPSPKATSAVSLEVFDDVRDFGHCQSLLSKVPMNGGHELHSGVNARGNSVSIRKELADFGGSGFHHITLHYIAGIDIDHRSRSSEMMSVESTLTRGLDSVSQ